MADGLRVLSDEIVVLMDLQEPLVLAMHRRGLLHRVPKGN